MLAMTSGLSAGRSREVFEIDNILMSVAAGIVGVDVVSRLAHCGG